MIRVRKVDPEVVRDICAELLWDEAGDSTWEPDGEYWGAYDGESLVGYAGLKRSCSWTDVVYFHTAGVKRAARGKHLQRRLIRARLSWAKRNGFAFARTYTVVHNPASARSLIACGFKPYWPTRPWAGRYVCYWVKSL